MNHYVELTIINDGEEKTFLGRLWCEYSSKKARKETLLYDILEKTAKELNTNRLTIAWHPEDWNDKFHYNIEKYDESIHDILFPETNEDVWVEYKVVETDR